MYAIKRAKRLSQALVHFVIARASLFSDHRTSGSSNTCEEYTWQNFGSKLMQSRWVFSRNRVIFDHCSKRYHWSVKNHSQPPFILGLPIRQEILNVSQISVTLHGICSPFVTQTGLQQYRRCPFLLSLCALLFRQSHVFLICVALTYNDSRKDLHRLCRIPRNCQCK